MNDWYFFVRSDKLQMNMFVCVLELMMLYTARYCRHQGCTFLTTLL